MEARILDTNSFIKVLMKAIMGFLVFYFMISALEHFYFSSYHLNAESYTRGQGGSITNEALKWFYTDLRFAFITKIISCTLVSCIILLTQNKKETNKQ